jgi:hypothetical protein
MMFNKVVAVVTALVGASSLFAGAAALPTNVTESAIAARAIDPAGTHTGQVCSHVCITGSLANVLGWRRS